MQRTGIDQDALDPATRPQDDLFRHVNGRWIADTPIPEDRARYGTFILLHEAAERAVRAILSEAQTAPADTEARKIGDLFTSFLDEQRCEALGSTPIADALQEAAAPTTIPAFVEALGRLEHAGVAGFVALFVDNDPGDPDRYRAFIEQGGIGLPDESYFREAHFAEMRTEYRAHIERMFALAGCDNVAVRAERVFTLETDIAATHWTNVDSRDSEKTYNPHTWEEAAARFDPTDLLTRWRDALGIPADHVAEIVLRQPSFLAGVGALLTPERLPAWRDWLAWQVIHGAAPYLSQAFVAENFAFYGRTLSGTQALRARWKRGVSFVEGAMGEAIGKLYVERHFPAAAKTGMDALVANLVAAYRASITDLDWMGDETRTRALEKLSKFTPKIGYPAKWRDYTPLRVDATDLLGNVRAVAAYVFQRELHKLTGPVDRDEWFMTPQTINAYYNPGFNEVVFPAAILQPPFFEPDRDAAANYGAIGAVIGHEIGHGFDDQGSKFDGDGRLIDWWTEADRDAFETRTGALAAQYGVLRPRQLDGHADEDTLHVNGALTIGENIGDLGGLAIAWQAYLLSLNGAEPPVIDGMSAGQRFFLSWAQAWREYARDAEVIRLLAIDPHSPPEFRCNQIVRNLPAFYEAFNVDFTDAAWLPPEDRVSIW